MAVALPERGGDRKADLDPRELARLLAEEVRLVES
jgi:hypothetical protein